MKKVFLTVIVLLVSSVFAPSALAAKPDIYRLGAYAWGGKVRISMSVSNNTNAIRVVYCPNMVTKKPIACKGRSVVFSPNKLACKPGYPRCGNWWGASFKAPGRTVSGYVVVSNSDGATKKVWIA